MPRLRTAKVTVDLENGEKLVFDSNVGDLVTVTSIDTYTGKMPPSKLEDLTRRYEILVSHKKTR